MSGFLKHRYAFLPTVLLSYFKNEAILEMKCIATTRAIFCSTLKLMQSGNRTHITNPIHLLHYDQFLVLDKSLIT